MGPLLREKVFVGLFRTRDAKESDKLIHVDFLVAISVHVLEHAARFKQHVLPCVPVQTKQLSEIRIAPERIHNLLFRNVAVSVGVNPRKGSL